jgi:hypothetical protein
MFEGENIASFLSWRGFWEVIHYPSDSKTLSHPPACSQIPWSRHTRMHNYTSGAVRPIFQIPCQEAEQRDAVNDISWMIQIPPSCDARIRPTLIPNNIKNRFTTQRKTNDRFNNEVTGNLLNDFTRQSSDDAFS